MSSATDQRDGEVPWEVEPASASRLGQRGKLASGISGDLQHFEAQRFLTEVDRLRMACLLHGEAEEKIAPVVDLAIQRWSGAKPDAAWSALKAADRELVDYLDSPALRMEGRRVLNEAKQKLSGWRLETIKECLTIADDPALDVDVDGSVRKSLQAKLKFARRLIDDYLDNVHLREHLLKGHLQRAGIVLVIVLIFLGAVLATLTGTQLAFDEVRPLSDVRAFILIASLGAFGAGLSGVLRFVSRDVSMGIPRLKAERTLIWLRPFVGAAAAVVLVAVLISGLIGLEVMNEASILVYALVAGFSEALVSRTVAKVSASIAG